MLYQIDGGTPKTCSRDRPNSPSQILCEIPRLANYVQKSTRSDVACGATSPVTGITDFEAGGVVAWVRATERGAEDARRSFISWFIVVRMH